MNQEKCNFNWHNYLDHLRNMLHQMMKSNELTDVTLICDDKIQFKAHKIVLSACSSVFKSIINDIQHDSSVLYLRGIQHQEMESILEFMYLGVTTFNQERMNEFLNVAKNLMVKEIYKDVEFDDAKVSNDKPDTLKPESNSQKNAEGKSTDEGAKYPCNQLQHHATLEVNLREPMQMMHKGVKYNCNQCEQQFSHQKNLTRHIKSIHEGVKYNCNQCEYQFSQQKALQRHIQSIHEGIKYPCNQCEHRATRKDLLKYHIQSKH